MYYPGDQVPFYLSLARADGADAEVTTPPIISILSAADDSALDVGAVGVKSATMAPVAGSDALYKFLWNTGGVADGTYIAIVSYVAAGVTISGRFLERAQVGDSRITGAVALDASVATKLDLPDKDAVMTKDDFISPSQDLFVQTILARINALPTWVASSDALTAALAKIADLHDAQLGTWTIDKSVHPNRWTLYRLDGTVLQSFDLTNDATSGGRTRR